MEQVADLFEVGRSSVLGRLQLKRETRNGNGESPSASVGTRLTRYPAKATTIQDVDEAGRPEEIGLCGRSGSTRRSWSLWTNQVPTPRWTLRGQERIEARPMNWQLGTGNWGKNLTMIGVVRLSGPVLLRTRFASANGTRFVHWTLTLVRKLHPGDIVAMDHAKVHHDRRVHQILKGHHVGLVYQAPYSSDSNPIEPAWARLDEYQTGDSLLCPSSIRIATKSRFSSLLVNHLQTLFPLIPTRWILKTEPPPI